MAKLCVLASLSLAGLLAVPSMSAETITLKVTRPPRLMLFYAEISIFVNGKQVGKISNGQIKEFQCSHVRIGINEVSATVKIGQQDVPLSSWNNKNNKFFEVKHRGEVIALSVGFNFFGAGYVEPSGEVQSGVEKVEMNKTLKSVILQETPPFYVGPGSKQEYGDTKTVRRDIKTSTTWRVEGDLKAEVDKVWASVAMEIRGVLERTTIEEDSIEITRTRNLTIIPSRSAVKLVWVEYFRTGTVTVVIDGGKEVRVPFEVPVELILRADAVH